jgi:glycosyltransferase involved in cell wall biosynthesis
MEKKKVAIVCSNYAWTIFNFRMPLIRKLKECGYTVVVITQFDGYEKQFCESVDQVKSLFISRKGVNPFVDLLTVFDLFRHLLIIKPSVLFLFTIKPVIYGSFVAKLLKVKTIATITGLGTSFIVDGFITKVVKFLYKNALTSVSTVFFQNIDDKSLFLKHGLIKPKVCQLSPGSGVDLNKFACSELPQSQTTTFLLVARMLWDKGVGEFVDAARVIKLQYPNTRFQLLGPLGVENHSSISRKYIDQWQEEGVIEYLGETDNVISYLKSACCIVLPSYREGTSRVLLEGAALCRPLIATDVPGCREVLEDRVNGFLCESHDYISLSYKMEEMLLLPFETRQNMGKNGRKKVEQEFNQDVVCQLYFDAI